MINKPPPANQLYIPKNAIPVGDVSEERLLLGIQGESGTGKTTAAASFPNPLWLLFENSLSHLRKHFPAEEIASWNKITFYDANFVDKTLGIPRFKGLVTDWKKAIPQWLDTHGKLMTKEQTIIVDSWTSLQDLFTKTQNFDIKLTKMGAEDDYYPWQERLAWSKTVMTTLSTIPCNVVVLFHEHFERDPKTKELTDKVAPLQQGKFISEIKRSFPNFFRQTVRARKGPDGKMITLPNGEPVVDYLWQTKSSGEFDAKNAFRGEIPAFVPAHYTSLKPSNQT